MVTKISRLIALNLVLASVLILICVFLTQKDSFRKFSTTNNQQIIVSLQQIKSPKAVIAILLNDFAINKENSDLALTLPIEVAFGAFGGDYNLQPRDLVFSLPPFEYNLSDKIFETMKNYQAIYTEAEDIYTKDENAAKLLLNNLKQHNILYICGATKKEATIYKVANEIDFNLIDVDVVIDEIQASKDIQARLKQAERIAKDKGYAMLKGSQYQLTIEELKAWLPSLAEKNIQLISIEQYYKIRDKFK